MLNPAMAMASKRRRSSPAVKHGYRGGAYGVSEGEGGDQVAGGGQGDIQVSRQAWQQSGNHEAFGSDRESAECQPEQ